MNKAKSLIDLKAFIAQAWTAMFVVFVANIVMDISRCQVLDTCDTWAAHLGYGGVLFLCQVMVIYAIMPVLVQSINAHWFRYVAIGLATLMTLFYVAHELSHLAANDKPFGLTHALDITHHVIGITVIVASVFWAREPKTRGHTDYSQSESKTGSVFTEGTTNGI